MSSGVKCHYPVMHYFWASFWIKSLWLCGMQNFLFFTPLNVQYIWNRIYLQRSRESVKVDFSWCWRRWQRKEQRKQVSVLPIEQAGLLAALCHRLSALTLLWPLNLCGQLYFWSMCSFVTKRWTVTSGTCVVWGQCLSVKWTLRGRQGPSGRECERFFLQTFQSTVPENSHYELKQQCRNHVTAVLLDLKVLERQWPPLSLPMIWR